MNPVTPTRVIGGRYVVLGELGRGGMGVVWRAEDRVMGRHVAVKELHLPDGLSADERMLFRERLLREARTAGRLNDPAIVTVYDVVSDGGVDHIVMELIEARTLADIVDAYGPLDERTVASVARQLVAALRTAHDNGVLHRDVKPSNVMLGPGDRVKLTDFGIAQAADDPRLTTTGSVVGSPGYLSPERLEGGPATPASDMWALGATLFHASTGIAPFARDTTAATIAAVLHADVPMARTRGPLGAVISGLLQRMPQARLSGMQVAALLAAEATMPITQAVAGTTSPMQPVQPRRRSVWWTVAALVVGLVLGGAGAYLLPRLGAPGVVAYSYGAGGDLPVFEPRSPACLQGQLAAGRVFPSGATVGCDEPHDLEIVQVLELFDASRVMPYPGREQLAGFAEKGCGVVFDSAVVVGADKARLQVVAAVPAESAFENQPAAGGSFPDRVVLCMVRAADGSQLTGTRVGPATG